MKEIYSLRSENLTNLGLHMGMEYTYDNWIKYFSNIEDAKKYAIKDYGKEIKWNYETDGLKSDDLLYVMYHIEKVDIL